MPADKIHQCRKCGAQIFWHKSERTGRFYPCDSPDDRRAFHQCDGTTTQPATKTLLTPSQLREREQQGGAKVEKPITPDYFEAALEERVATLEKQLVLLTRTVQEVRAAQPITDEDVGF